MFEYISSSQLVDKVLYQSAPLIGSDRFTTVCNNSIVVLSAVRLPESTRSG